MPNKNQKNLIDRPPVVVVMGHIDHGKSTLLDYIRKANVVSGEAGGITQHVGAYQAKYNAPDGKTHVITFLDTPGHEAFCNIRERGTKVADIAILIVSAEDGVKPQTIEVYKNIKEEKTPFVVAITKTDKPNANVEKTKQSLGENEIYIEGFGGDIPCVEISSTTGKGIPELLEIVMLLAELASLKTDPKAPAEGTIIESTLDARKGISATLLMKNGTLSVGSFVSAGNAFSPVRFIEDFKGDKIEKATASMPIRITGWNTTPGCGERFTTIGCKKEAEKMIEKLKTQKTNLPDKKTVGMRQNEVTPNKDAISSETDASKEMIISIPIIIKADVIGSLDGVKHELAKIKNGKVQLKIISEGIGEINENDVKLAQSNPNIEIIGFNVMPDKKSAIMIERNPVSLNVSSFKIIYQLSEYVRDLVVKNIPKEYEEVVTGRAKILALFSKDKDRQVIGGKVETGIIGIGNEVRIMRRDTEIGRGKVRELQQAKKRTSEVREGFEFGTLIEARVEIATGDRVETVKTVEKQ
jgi:translation initiation factor IF-2